MKNIISAAKKIRDGESVPMPLFLDTLRRAELVLAAQCPLCIHRIDDGSEGEDGGGEAAGRRDAVLIVGPVRGHATDFAHYVLTEILPPAPAPEGSGLSPTRRSQRAAAGEATWEHLVLLGNYVDGDHRSVEVLYLVALLVLHVDRLNRAGAGGPPRSVVPLLGRHELLYPLPPELFGSLRDELLLRARHTGRPLASYDVQVASFFSRLPVACVLYGRYLCVAGGPAASCRYVTPRADGGATAAAAPAGRASQLLLREFVLNEQMDEDEERMAEGCAFVSAASDSAGGKAAAGGVGGAGGGASVGPGAEASTGLRYTFNAACNFLRRNGLTAMVTGMEYHLRRPDYDSFAKPNHYKESVYFPGHILGRGNPDTGIPAVIALFSAPHFCGINRNAASLLALRRRPAELLVVRELGPFPARPLITPGRQNVAFAWAQPMLEKAVTAIAREMLLGTVRDAGARGDGAEAPQKQQQQQQPLALTPAERRWEQCMIGRMRRMCMLLKAHGLPLPKIEKLDGQ